MKFDYRFTVVNLLNIFIVFIFTISILLVINSLYNLILIVSDTDESIYRSDYNKYKSIRELLGYKILMNSYKSEPNRTKTEYYDDTYLTLNANTFLLRLAVDSTVIIAIILGSITVMALLCYMDVKQIGTDINDILSEKFPLILTSIVLFIIIIIFNITNTETIKVYKASRLDTSGTAENAFIKNYLIYYDGIHSTQVNGKELSTITPIKIESISEAIKNKNKNTIFESILNKLKYLDKYNIANEASLAEMNETVTEKIRIETIAKDKKTYTDKKAVSESAPTTEETDKNIISYCYYFTVINKDNNVDPVKLIYEFIKKVKGVILEKASDVNNAKGYDVNNAIGSIGDEFAFLIGKFKPSILIFGNDFKDDNNVSEDYKYENLFIESMYTCDYIDGTGREIVRDIKDNMNRAKSEKKAILIAIVATFMVILIAIFLFFNSTKISIYWSWTYLDNIKRDSGMLPGAINYLANLLKFNTIVAPKKQ